MTDITEREAKNLLKMYAKSLIGAFVFGMIAGVILAEVLS